MQRLGEHEAIGPIFLGAAKPLNVIHRGSSVNEIIDLAALTAVEAQSFQKKSAKALEHLYSALDAGQSIDESHTINVIESAFALLGEDHKVTQQYRTASEPSQDK